jgi:hypothetical protein
MPMTMASTCRVRQHPLVVGVDILRVVEPAEVIREFLVCIADRMQCGIAGLLHRLEMRELRNGPAAENAYSQDLFRH